MGWTQSLHGHDVRYDRSNIYLFGRAVGAELGAGKKFYVDSNVDGGDGSSWDTALGTIDEAINKCVANRGDRIFVDPDHSETITTAAAIDIDVHGISIIGLKNGNKRPQVIFNNTAATIELNADNLLVQGIQFTSSLDSVALGLNVLTGSTNVWIDDCLFDVEAAATDEFDLSIRFAAACDYGKVTNCVFDMDLADAVMAIQVIDCDRVEILNNWIMGDYSTACVGGLTTLSTNVRIGGNLLLNGEGGNLGSEPAIELITGSTGIIYDNYIVCNLATKAASVVADTCLLFENYYNEDISGSATGGIIGTASADD